jgi:DNA-directed RNA polymerase subunit N (RpoN/RPB10)
MVEENQGRELKNHTDNMSKEYYNLNADLPPLRCYSCNKSLSHLYAPYGFTGDKSELLKNKELSRYCCKLMVLQDNIKA